MTAEASWRLCAAPLMRWSDRRARRLLRLLSAPARLYAPMTPAIRAARNDPAVLDFCEAEHPLALQLGGMEPQTLAQATIRARERGWDEVNLNAGCPSKAACAQGAGAALMRDPDAMARGVEAIARHAGAMEVSLKCRLGVDDQDPDAVLLAFVRLAREAGATTLILHARKAVLGGLSPRANRSIPPLELWRGAALKQHFPDLRIVLNGGIATPEAAVQASQGVDGVMVGRGFVADPWLIARMTARLFPHAAPAPSAAAFWRGWLAYAEARLAAGDSPSLLTRPMMGLAHGIAGARDLRMRMAAARTIEDLAAIGARLGAGLGAGLGAAAAEAQAA